MNSSGRRKLLLGTMAALLLALPLTASAERLASRTGEATASREADAARVEAVLARGDVARALAAHGLPPGAVEDRLAQLSDEDVRRLAAHLEQVQTAGSVPNYIWILLAAFLAVSTLAIIF